LLYSRISDNQVATRLSLRFDSGPLRTESACQCLVLIANTFSKALPCSNYDVQWQLVGFFSTLP